MSNNPYNDDFQSGGYYFNPLIPTQIEILIGNNSFASDSGSIDLTYKDLDIAKRGNFREVFKLPN